MPILIDKTKIEFEEVPNHLNGMILVDKKITNGLTVWFTVTPNEVQEMKTKTDEELETIGWLIHKDFITNFQR